MKAWVISYNPYTDILQLYDSRVIDKNFPRLTNRIIDSWKVGYYKEQPFFIEIVHTYEQVGDVETMPKEAIIEKVKEKV